MLGVVCFQLRPWRNFPTFVRMSRCYFAQGAHCKGDFLEAIGALQLLLSAGRRIFAAFELIKAGPKPEILSLAFQPSAFGILLLYQIQRSDPAIRLAALVRASVIGTSA